MKDKEKQTKTWNLTLYGGGDEILPEFEIVENKEIKSDLSDFWEAFQAKKIDFEPYGAGFTVKLDVGKMENFDRIIVNGITFVREEVYEHYQPKLPKDSVVLSKEEYELLTNDLDKHDYGEFESGYSQGSKETAEKIYSFAVDFYDGSEQWELFLLRFKEKFGVEIKE